MSPTLIRRMVDQAKAKASNPLLGSQLGQLRLTNVIGNSEMAAGVLYGEVVRRYWHLKGVPSPSPHAQSYEGRVGTNLAEEPDDDAVIHATKQYEAVRAILGRIGSMAIRAVDAVILFDVFISPTSHSALCSGLQSLVTHFGLTTKAR